MGNSAPKSSETSQLPLPLSETSQLPPPTTFADNIIYCTGCKDYMLHVPKCRSNSRCISCSKHKVGIIPSVMRTLILTHRHGKLDWGQPLLSPFHEGYLHTLSKCGVDTGSNGFALEATFNPDDFLKQLLSQRKKSPLSKKYFEDCLQPEKWNGENSMQLILGVMKPGAKDDDKENKLITTETSHLFFPTLAPFSPPYGSLRPPTEVLLSSLLLADPLSGELKNATEVKEKILVMKREEGSNCYKQSLMAQELGAVGVVMIQVGAWPQFIPSEEKSEMLKIPVLLISPTDGEKLQQLMKSKMTEARIISRARWVRCPICQRGVEQSEAVTKLPCYHFYHPSCINKWLEQQNSCPLCLFSLPAQASAEDVFVAPTPLTTESPATATTEDPAAPTTTITPTTPMTVASGETINLTEATAALEVSGTDTIALDLVVPQAEDGGCKGGRW